MSQTVANSATNHKPGAALTPAEATTTAMNDDGARAASMPQTRQGDQAAQAQVKNVVAAAAAAAAATAVSASAAQRVHQGSSLQTDPPAATSSVPVVAAVDTHGAEGKSPGRSGPGVGSPALKEALRQVAIAERLAAEAVQRQAHFAAFDTAHGGPSDSVRNKLSLQVSRRVLATARAHVAQLRGLATAAGTATGPGGASTAAGPAAPGVQSTAAAQPGAAHAAPSHGRGASTHNSVVYRAAPACARLNDDAVAARPVAAPGAAALIAGEHPSAAREPVTPKRERHRGRTISAANDVKDEVKDEVKPERHGARAHAAKHEHCHRPVAAQCRAAQEMAAELSRDNVAAACVTPTNDDGDDDGSDDACKVRSAGAGGRATRNETPAEERLRRKRESARASMRRLRQRRGAASAGATGSPAPGSHAAAPVSRVRGSPAAAGVAVPVVDPVVQPVAPEGPAAGAVPELALDDDAIDRIADRVVTALAAKGMVVVASAASAPREAVAAPVSALKRARRRAVVYSDVSDADNNHEEGHVAPAAAAGGPAGGCSNVANKRARVSVPCLPPFDHHQPDPDHAGDEQEGVNTTQGAAHTASGASGSAAVERRG